MSCDQYCVPHSNYHAPGCSKRTGPVYTNPDLDRQARTVGIIARTQELMMMAGRLASALDELHELLEQSIARDAPSPHVVVAMRQIQEDLPAMKAVAKAAMRRSKMNGFPIVGSDGEPGPDRGGAAGNG